MALFGPDPDPWQLIFSHPLIKEVFNEVMEKSPLFRDAVEKMIAKNFVVRMGSAQDLEALNKPRGERNRIKMDPNTGAITVYAPEGPVQEAGVFFDVDRFHKMTGEPVDSARAREYLRDAILHEVYGHVVPVAQAGDASGRVADPQPGQDFRRSPVGLRENEVRRDLGLPPKSFYGLFQ